MMNSILFIALPLLFGFSTPIFAKFGKNSVAYISTIMQLFLLYLASYLLMTTSAHIEIIAIAPPLGISFVVTKVSLLFVLMFTFLSSLFSLYYLHYRKNEPYKNETKFFVLINMLLASTIGLVLSSDIFNIYVFFEIAGISAYILSAYKQTASSLEAGLKYLLTGSIASIFLLFAIMLIYLYTGSLNLSIIAQHFTTLPYNIKILISIFLLIGFGFKIEIFPLNFWVVDVYQGSTSLINALFSGIVVKAYLFLFFHLLYLFIPDQEFTIFLLYLGSVSMLIAEIVGLRQTDIKRVFAYSSLGQVALIFIAFSMQTQEAVQSALFIFISHSIAKFLIFLIISTLYKEESSFHIEKLKKINSIFLKIVLTIAMLSLLGIPLFMGFIGKFLVLKSLAFNAFFGVLFIIIVASLIEAVYYFKILGFIFSKYEEKESINISFIQKGIFSLLALLLVIIGIFPISISNFLSESATILLNYTQYLEGLQ